jgi:hypothetical protein
LFIGLRPLKKRLSPVFVWLALPNPIKWEYSIPPLQRIQPSPDIRTCRNLYLDFPASRTVRNGSVLHRFPQSLVFDYSNTTMLRHRLSTKPF